MPRAWRYDLSAPPRTRNLVDDFRHVSHHLSGLIHRLSDLIHHLSGLIHRLSGLIHRLSGLIHHLSGSIHCFSSLTHHFSGLSQDFHGEACFSHSAVAASPCTTFCQGRHPALVFVKTCSHAGRTIPGQPLMQRGTDVYRFSPFELDSAHRRLIRGGEPLAIPDRHIDILLLLVSNAGRIVSKDALIAAGWTDVNISDNSIAQAILSLRKVLGTGEGGMPYIETVPRRGYRFVAPVELEQPRQSAAALDALLAPYRAFVDGRAALEILDLDALDRARQAFEDALRAASDYPAAHIGMANARVLRFESTRADAVPDVAALQQAHHHAHEACRLDPLSADAWSTLAFVLHRKGHGRDAIAAARKALTLDPEDWRHYLRLACVSWGEERLLAARRVLTLCPELAFAHWFVATVFVARQAFDSAIRHLRAGCAAQDAQRTETGRFHAVGLHLLRGLVLAAQGADDEALEKFAGELAAEEKRHLYARECGATTWYAIGAVQLRQGRRQEAEAAFHEALLRVPGHGLASVGLAAISSSSQTPARSDGANTVDAAMVKAAVVALDGRHHDAAALWGDALVQAEPGSAGWLLPVDPLLHVTAHPEAWAQALATLRHRAT